ESENLDACRIDVYFEEILDLIIMRFYFNLNWLSYAEVTSFLKIGEIDFDNKRFLILQGVEFLSQMKPKVPNKHEDRHKNILKILSKLLI
ncbi:7201_t:CDS:2, partial [Funneliformis caledonium]